MSDTRKKRKISKTKKFPGFLFVIFILFLIVISFFFILKPKLSTRACGDGTLEGECSLRKPYFCSDGILIEKASVCGCNKNLSVIEDSCISKYQIEPKNITLKYILRGEEKEINFVVYKGMVDYLSSLPASIYYKKGEQPSRADFKLRNINNEEQRELLLPLVTEIQNRAKDKTEQMRIAVSIVQKIPFGNSEKTFTFRNSILNYSRYPYEVLYDIEGVCGEKSELLAFLLREMDYGVVFFYNAFENHEALGIKCPVRYSLDETGYCFIETTGGSIITDNEIEYFGVGRLYSKPEIIFISDGNSLRNSLYEYKDARDLKRIRNVINNKGKLNIFQDNRYRKLKVKYGLEEIYNI